MVEERRLYPRLKLEVDDGYFAQLLLPDQETLSAAIINLSAGGIHLILPAAAKERLQEGDELLLQNILGGRTLYFLADVKAEVRWIRPAATDHQFSAGCKFRDLAEPVRQQLSQFVHSERMTRGQYD